MNTLAFGSIGWQELLLLGVLAVLIFGRRLPEVGRSLGRSLVEFKRGLKDAGHELRDVDQAARDAAQSARDAAGEAHTTTGRADAAGDPPAVRDDA